MIKNKKEKNLIIFILMLLPIIWVLFVNLLPIDGHAVNFLMPLLIPFGIVGCYKGFINSNVFFISGMYLFIMLLFILFLISFLINT